MNEKVKNIIVTFGLTLAAITVVGWYFNSQETAEPSFTLSELQDYAESKAATGISNTEWKDFEAGFVESCNEDGTNKKYCDCTLSYLKANNTREEIYQASADFLASDEDAPLPVPLSDAIYACIGLYN